MKIRTLVITRRKTTLPAAIAKFLEAAGITPVIADPQCDIKSVEETLSKAKPRLVIIDGQYSQDDADLWKRLSALDALALRQHLLLKPNEVPEGLSILRIVHASNGSRAKVMIFIDAPSDALKENLKRLGADIVWSSLTTVSETEASLYRIISGTKDLGKGVKGLLGQLGECFDKKYN